MIPKPTEAEAAVPTPDNLLKLVIHPDPTGVLKTKVQAVSEETMNSDEMNKAIDGMITTMYHYNGIGIAANQVGLPLALFIMDTTWHDYGIKEPQVFINPVITDYGPNVASLGGRGEGCLSTPYGFNSPVNRANKVKISWRDENWEEHEEWFEDIEAICVQHEIDHLHGYLFVDRISRLRRDIFDRKVKKQRRRYAKGMKKTMTQFKEVMKTEARFDKASKRKNTRSAKRLKKGDGK
jgi:peptide deformylase